MLLCPSCSVREEKSPCSLGACCRGGRQRGQERRAQIKYACAAPEESPSEAAPWLSKEMMLSQVPRVMERDFSWCLRLDCGWFATREVISALVGLEQGCRGEPKAQGAGKRY